MPETTRRDINRLMIGLCVPMLLASPFIHADHNVSGSATPVLAIEGIKVSLDLSQVPKIVDKAQLLAWVQRSIQVVKGYYGRFPVDALWIDMITERGGGIRGGTTWGSPRAHIRMHIGKAVTHQELVDDWMLIHEMIHLTFPDVGSRHSWLAEGIATYVEGIARVHAGSRTAHDVWAEFMQSMPQGLPKRGDRGLDHTRTWGRTYWGGALFCLLADVEIHRRTDNRFGLQDALRAIMQASGGLTTEWSIQQTLSTGDAAVGIEVLAPLYQQMKDKAVDPDLAGLWRQLGIVREGHSVVLRDAPLATSRDAIMTAWHGA